MDAADVGAMKVGWVTPNALFARVIGGAEIADENMISKAPDGVTVDVLPANDGDYEEYDRIVVAGTRGMSLDTANRLTRCDVVAWLHHEQDRHAVEVEVYRNARWVLCLTPMHLEWEQKWIGHDRFDLNAGWFDTSDMEPGKKSKDALWAHRMIWHKGLTRAEAWAEENSAALTVMYDKPRRVVLDAMAEHSRFVLLSLILDPGPFTVMEAQLSGCELVVNENVGWYDEPQQALRRRIEAAPARFWERVCG